MLLETQQVKQQKIDILDQPLPDQCITKELKDLDDRLRKLKCFIKYQQSYNIPHDTILIENFKRYWTLFSDSKTIRELKQMLKGLRTE